MIEEVGNDGIVDGFEVKESFKVAYDSGTLPKVDAESLDAEWKEFYEKGLVKCSNDGVEHVDMKFHKGDRVYFSQFNWSRDLVFSIMKEYADKITVLK